MRGSLLQGRPPEDETDDGDEHARHVRRIKLHAQRNDQLREPATRAFIKDMERSRLHACGRASIFNLMCDGRKLATRLRNATGPEQLKVAVKPYIQFVKEGSVCPQTGFRLMDIWRYFRHTWANPYQSIPGRSMVFLVRDAAAPCHPVMGIAALSSAAMKMKARDEFIGWEPVQVVASLQQKPSRSVVKWLNAATKELLEALYLSDLLEDKLITTRDIEHPTEAVVKGLDVEAKRQKTIHQKLMAGADYKETADEDKIDADERWEDQARTPLFRSKRCAELAALLRIGLTLEGINQQAPDGLAKILSNAAGRQAVGQVVRRIKAQRVGTAIADLTVCGAVPPYHAILGGKLVAALAISPAVVAEYRRRYGKATSVIASSMAGQPVKRPAHLVFVGTTSLYGIRPCQYDRIAIPLSLFDPKAAGAIKYHFIDETEGWGTFQFGKATTAALGEFMRSQRNGVQVNYVFGEGANPKLRALRDGLNKLGFDHAALLRHGMAKLIYGVPLISNLREYLLGMETRPRFLAGRMRDDDAVHAIAGWWLERWVAPRLARSETLAEIERHTLIHPITHGARVILPMEDLWQPGLF